jgi:hypothetical protein
MSKRPSLTETMRAVAAQKEVTPAPAVRQSQPERTPEGDGNRKRHFAATREGMKRITVAVAPDEHKKLKRLAVDAGRSIEDLMREALADLFAKHE